MSGLNDVIESWLNAILSWLQIGDWAKSVVDWITANLDWLFGSIIGDGLKAMYEGINWVLATPPFWLVILALVAIAVLAASWQLGVGTLVGLLVIYGMEQWDHAMQTLALIIVATVIATVLAVPVGILTARNETVSTLVRPILDFMQTMPPFVYLIPAVIIFSTGPTPGMVATIIFAMAPGVRFTELGIRQVDEEVVEAGHAFGAAPRRILRQIQIPLALPTIMAGINQIIMLALSMVVLAGMVGAPGLGQDVVASLQRVNVALGVEAGLGVVILAMYLDRVTSGLSERAPVNKAMKIRAG